MCSRVTQNRRFVHARSLYLLAQVFVIIIVRRLICVIIIIILLYDVMAEACSRFIPLLLLLCCIVVVPCVLFSVAHEQIISLLLCQFMSIL